MTSSQELYNPSQRTPILSEQEMVFLSEGAEVHALQQQAGQATWAARSRSISSASSFASDQAVQLKEEMEQQVDSAYDKAQGQARGRQAREDSDSGEHWWVPRVP